jgi:hypothetical protein
MPLDGLGCTCATIAQRSGFCGSEMSRESFETVYYLELTFVILGHELGIPSKDKSLPCADYVPALCTHRPSLQPIG